MVPLLQHRLVQLLDGPTVTILDAGHTIRWIDVHRNYVTRTDPAEIVHALDRQLRR